MNDEVEKEYSSFIEACREHVFSAAEGLALKILSEDTSISDEGAFLYSCKYVVVDGDIISSEISFSSIKRPGGEPVSSVIAEIP